MPLVEPLPAPIENTLHRLANSDELRIAFPTDISMDGQFGEEWLVVSSDRIWVLKQNGKSEADIREDIPLNSVKTAHASMQVGNGVLELELSDKTVQLVRYSHNLIAKANAAARQINKLSKEEEITDEVVEERQRCPKCNRMLPDFTQVCPACLNKGQVISRLFRFMAPYKLILFLSAVLMITSTFTDLVPAFITKLIIDRVLTSMHGHTLVAGHIDPYRVRLLLMFIMFLALSRVLGSVISIWRSRLNAWLGGRVLLDVRAKLYERLQWLSLGYYDKRNTGAVMSRITNDTNNLQDFLVDGIPWGITNILQLFGIGIILFAMNWRLAALVLIPAPFIVVLTRWFWPRMRRRWHHVWHRWSKMNSTLASTLYGMRVVKAFAQERREISHFNWRNQSLFEANFSAESMWSYYGPMLGLLMSLGSLIIWYQGGLQELAGVMTLGTLMLFNQYLWQFYAPLQVMSRALDWTTRSLTAAERVFEVLDTEPEVKEANEPVPMLRIEGDVEFNKVSFGYDNSKRVIEDFSLEVKAGEMVGLVGHSGAGKSTVINLLARFYDVNEGSIEIDGVDIRKIRSEDLRSQLGIVLQDPFLFPGTIRENIAYAKPDATLEEIMQAAKAANCHEFILKFPDGYDTWVGERGQRLSGGERQRISIARAILHNPRILILDEATASVDTETERQIQQAIARLTENRTTFAIAHRLSTLRNADRLIVIDNGKLVESGTHDELVEKDGVYAKLVKIQTEINRIRAA